jgi:HPt (histidine-containing phosphotransfer) domain-containing protein
MQKQTDIDGFLEEMEISAEEGSVLYTFFIEELLQEKSALQEQANTENYGQMAETVHNIKGVSSSYKSWNVFHIVSSMDDQCKKRDFNNIQQNVDILSRMIEEEIVKIKAYFNME